ncbi:MAG: DNA mismatch repair endonuclease MutL [Candidatus Rokubacteria bacterium]|nr:DNA mismatch repair endonuclease MutL [Candidatus Rokubacteria bacterium]
MTRIRILPAALVNKIAAGEVVERPASVVKELVENSLDAGAERIVVEVRGAGRQLIRVADDGHGMTREECLLALQRHATSKIGLEEDLAAIQTLGFRGEALPAIFAVSRLLLLSTVPGAAGGTLVRGEGGRVAEVLEADGPVGTSAEVRDLFFNTPARLKFLKSPPTEQAAIARTVTQLALAHPGCHVRLVSNERTLLNAPRARTLRDRLGALYGFGVAARLLEVLGEAGEARLEGLISPPQISRTHREEIALVVNGRPVRDTLLTQALLEAYRPLLPRDHFPLALLVLTLPPSQLDINVHPTKAWVRFRQPRHLHDLVHGAVSAALRRLEAVPARAVSLPAAGAAEPGAAPAAAAAMGLQASLFREEEAAYGAGRLFGEPVGQIEETFIVAYTAEEVFFVDQHVAHERVLFERLRTDLEAGPLAGQELLFPQPLELAPARRELLEAWLPALGRLGFSLESFGGTTLLIRSVPSLLRDDDPQRLVDDLVGELPPGEAQVSPAALDRLLAFVACRAAIKAFLTTRVGDAAFFVGIAILYSATGCLTFRDITIKRDLRRDW